MLHMHTQTSVSGTFRTVLFRNTPLGTRFSELAQQVCDGSNMQLPGSLNLSCCVMSCYARVPAVGRRLCQMGTCNGSCSALLATDGMCVAALQVEDGLTRTANMSQLLAQVCLHGLHHCMPWPCYLT